MQLGTSPKHFTGTFQPKTFYEYDEQGKIKSTWTESVWDDYERMLLDAYFDWKDGIHDCGRHVSESLQLVGRPDPVYTVGQRICLACKALDNWVANRSKGWEPLHKEGHHPERYTLPRVLLVDEAKAEIEAGSAAEPDI